LEIDAQKGSRGQLTSFLIFFFGWEKNRRKKFGKWFLSSPPRRTQVGGTQEGLRGRWPQYRSAFWYCVVRGEECGMKKGKKGLEGGTHSDFSSWAGGYGHVTGEPMQMQINTNNLGRKKIGRGPLGRKP